MNIPKVLEPLAKVTAMALVVLLNGVGLLGVGDTYGYYFDIERSGGNELIAGNVDFTATSTEWNPLHVAVSMQPGDTTFKDFDIDPLTSNPFQYYASTTVSGDTAFCDGVTVDFDQSANTLYSGTLSGLITGTTTSTSTFNLSATTGINNFQNSVCDVLVNFEGWQTRHGYPTVGGFNDIETVETKLASWGFRINKVYADVAPDRYATTTTTEGENEWVEIYNQTNVDLDISGWEICDNLSCDTIPAGTPVIPQMGYGVIVHSPNVFSATGTAPWYLPAGVIEIVLNDNIGNGLSNAADMLVLKRPDGVIVDQMNWGSPGTGWTNYNTDVWDPGVLAAAEGNLLARVPSGFDTDRPSDWTELTPPSVDLIYPNETGSYTWYWNHTYKIKWTATNPNGPDGDLDISLFYIKDSDYSGDITDADTTHTIVDTTQNDGKYRWKVPSGFLGYIWIKLVATGPENPLNNSRTISDAIWDPSPLLIGPEGVTEETLDAVDTEAPVITLAGNNPAYVEQGAMYSDLPAYVTDNVNNNLGYTTEGEVDTETLGEYTITYTATDQAGNVGTATRTVVVYDPAIGIPEPEPAESEPTENLEEEPAAQEEVVQEKITTPAASSGGGGNEPAVQEEDEAINEKTTTEEEEEVIVEQSEEAEEEQTEESVEETTTEEEATEEETTEGETEETQTEETEETAKEEVAEEEETIETKEATTEEEEGEVEEQTEEKTTEESNEEEVQEQPEEEIIPFREEDDSEGDSVIEEEQVLEEMENEEVPEEAQEEVAEPEVEPVVEEETPEEVEHE